MPRDFTTERHVRLYTADTAGWLLLGWQGQTVWSLLYRKANKHGVITLDGFEPWQVPMRLCGLPEEVAKPGIERCLHAAWLVLEPERLVIPRYVDANRAAKSNAQRQRDFRERLHAKQLEIARLCNEPLPDHNEPSRLSNGRNESVTASNVTGNESLQLVRAQSELGAQEQKRATAAAAWLSKATGREPYIVNKRWRESLLQLAELLAKSPDDRARAAEVLAREAARGIDVALMLSPEHVVSFWHFYRLGRAPGKRGPVTAAPARTELENLQEQYAELDRRERACLFDEGPKRARLNERMQEISARIQTIKEGQNGRS